LNYTQMSTYSLDIITISQSHFINLQAVEFGHNGIEQEILYIGKGKSSMNLGI